MVESYVWGGIAVFVFWFISYLVTNKSNPFALARGVDNNYSLSLLQFLIFSYVVIFSYIAIYVLRLTTSLTPLPEIPLNLLALMGLSVVSATASKGIVISYIEQGKLSESAMSKSGITKDENGNIALTKVQMLIWTLIAGIVYLRNVVVLINNPKLLVSLPYALPDVDGTLLVLMGAAQGGYIGGKLVARNTGIPVIQRVLSPVLISNPNAKVTIFGGLFGESSNGNTVVYQLKTTKAQYEVPIVPANQWKDNRIDFAIPQEMKTPGIYTLWVNVNGQESNGVDIVVTE